MNVIDFNVIAHIAKYANLHEFLERKHRFEWMVYPNVIGDVGNFRGSRLGWVVELYFVNRDANFRFMRVTFNSNFTVADIIILGVRKIDTFNMIPTGIVSNMIPTKFPQEIAINFAGKIAPRLVFDSMRKCIADSGWFNNTTTILSVQQKVALVASEIERFLSLPVMESSGIPIPIPSAGLIHGNYPLPINEVVWCFHNSDDRFICFTIASKDVFGFVRQLIIRFTIDDGEEEDSNGENMWVAVYGIELCGFKYHDVKFTKTPVHDLVLKDIHDVVRRNSPNYHLPIISQINQVLYHPRRDEIYECDERTINGLMIEILGDVVYTPKIW